MLTRELLKEALQSKIGTVVFTKADGSERTMRCTLQESYLPAVSEPKETDKVRGTNLNVLSVWDVDAQGWRSFKIDSIISTDI